MTVFNDSKYTRWYYAIVNARLINPVTQGQYSESHHIIPESFFIERTREGPTGWLEGDPDAGDNKVSLTAREHFICHWLLTKMTKGQARVKMMDAIMGMRAENKNQQRYKTKITSRVYDHLKKEYSLISSERMMRENNPQWGRVWTDEEKQAQADKVRGEKNGAKKPGVGDKIADTKRGVKREAFSQEWLNNLSAAHSGEGNGMYGKTHKQSTVELLSHLASLRTYSEETNDKRRVASSGRKEITDGVIYKKVKIDDLQHWLDQGWIVKGKPRKKKVTA